MERIFQDLKVIELASVLAGPSVGMFFAELGANVLKIENKQTGGDVTRQWKIKGEKQEGPAAYYHSINYGKQSLMLDLKDSRDLSICHKEIESADIVLTNYNETTALKLGVDYDQVIHINPNIIFAQLYGFESSRSRVAYDIVLQAESGFLSMSGTPKGNLTRMPVALIDVLAGHQLKEAILIALLKRAKTGQGSFVSTSLEETAISSLVNQATNYLMVDHIPKPMGTAHPNIAPYGDIFMTKDTKKLVLAVGSDRQFKSLCQLLEIDSVATDEKYETNENRVENRESLYELLVESIRKWESKPFLDACEQENIPVGRINNMEDVFTSEIGKSMILEETSASMEITKRVKTVAFHIQSHPPIKK